MKREVVWKVIDEKTRQGSNIAILMKYGMSGPGESRTFISKHPEFFPKYLNGEIVQSVPNTPGIFCLNSLKTAEEFVRNNGIMFNAEIIKVEGIDKREDELCLFTGCGYMPENLGKFLKGCFPPKMRTHNASQYIKGMVNSIVRFGRVVVLKSNDDGWAGNQARELLSWLDDACGDAALGMIECDDCGQYQEKSNQMKKENPHWDKYDHSSWLSEYLYNDVDELYSFLADRIYDTSYAEADRKAVAESLKEIGHSEIKKACDAYMEGR